MQTRTLGRSGIAVSIVGLGTNNFGDRTDFAASAKVLYRALDLGITLIDTADAYGKTHGASEEIIGRLLGPRRKDVVLATKFGIEPGRRGRGRGRASRAYIMEAVEASLKRLRTDWIDLYQVHQPDPETPIEETLGALDDLVKAGKVRAVGCSNFSADRVEAAMGVAQARGLTAFVAAQDQYSLLARGIERALLPALARHGLALLPYFPLASGLLTGKYKPGAAMPEGSRLSYSQRHIARFVTETNWRMVEALQAFCDARGRGLLELAFGWLVGNPRVASVIAGATRPEQLDANVRAVDWALTPAERAEVERITEAATDPGQGRIREGDGAAA
ncbi:MAG TPA: aldo/keto reductase [Xanthobacteraceae bacterium]|nr:aldo/keto reductase [Xanthobacteraceae bacterium]